MSLHSARNSPTPHLSFLSHTFIFISGSYCPTSSLVSVRKNLDASLCSEVWNNSVSYNSNSNNKTKFTHTRFAPGDVRVKTRELILNSSLVAASSRDDSSRTKLDHEATLAENSTQIGPEAIPGRDEPLVVFKGPDSAKSSSSFHTPGAEEDFKHPCLRPCNSSTTKMQCFYKFKVRVI